MTNLLSFLDNNDLMTQLSFKVGEYGQNQRYRTQTRIYDAIKLSETFGFDTEVVCGILYGIDYSIPIFGKYGENFLKKIDSNYSRSNYAKDIIKKLLSRVENSKIDTICDGIDHVLNKKSDTAEEQIVDIVSYCYDYVDRLPNMDLRNLYTISYFKKVIEKSSELGRIATLEFPKDDKIKLRERATVDKEKAIKNMKKYYDYCKNHYDTEIPETFKRGFEEKSKEEIIAHYLATRGENYVINSVYEIEREEKKRYC